jgi:hypothetical protein
VLVKTSGLDAQDLDAAAAISRSSVPSEPAQSMSHGDEFVHASGVRD